MISPSQHLLFRGFVLQFFQKEGQVVRLLFPSISSPIWDVPSMLWLLLHRLCHKNEIYNYVLNL